MFLGHFAVGLLAKKKVPEVNLGIWCLAAQALDVLWPVFLLLGWEKVAIEPGNTVVTPLNFLSYPWSHSLAMACFWGVCFAAVHFAFKRNLRAALLLAAVVVSHWVLDALFHRPDLALRPGDPALFGLGLWNHKGITLAAEYGSFGMGLFFYASSTRAKDRIGHRSLAIFSLMMSVVYTANVFGPPPPDVHAVATAGVFMPLLFAWLYWIDAHRVPAESAPK